LDNVLKATVDAIAESDNEIGGLLITRTRVRAHVFGQNNASVVATNVLTSLVDVFDVGMVGMGLAVIVPATGIASGNEGDYLIASFVNAKNVTVTTIDGAAVTFVVQSTLRWRLTTLRVESTLGFQLADKNQSLWIGEEDQALPYAQCVLTPGAQEFRGVGPQAVYTGTIAAGGVSVATTGAAFVAGDVGKALYVFPASPATGNEGPRRIVAVAGDGKSVTVTGSNFAVTETAALFAIKIYDTENGYLRGNVPGQPAARQLIRELSDVVDASRAFSAVDRLWRALMPAYATGDELDRLARNLGVRRLPSMGDEVLRALIITLPYLPKGTLYGLELLLDALYPGGGWTIYEDLINFPCQVFLLLTSVQGASSVFVGKTFLSPTGVDVTPPTDPGFGGAAQGRSRRERKTITGTTTLNALGHTPTTVVDLLVAPYQQTLNMSVLPSAAAQAWTFVAVGAGTEGGSFAVAGGLLTMTPTGAPSADGGRYQRAMDQQDYLPGSVVQFGAWFRVVSVTTITSYAWAIEADDSVIGRKFGVFFSATGWLLGGSLADPNAVTGTWVLDVGAWNRIELVRETTGAGLHMVTLTLNGTVIARVSAALLVASSGTTLTFGHSGVAGTQEWVVSWDTAVILVSSDRNHFNLARADGVFSGADNQLASAAGLFVAGDTGRRLRIRTGLSAGIGVWRATYVSATVLSLAGVAYLDLATLTTTGANNFIDLLDPLFTPHDVGKQITVSGTVLNPGSTRTILQFVDHKRVRVSGIAFVAEQGVDFQLVPYDGTTTNVFAAQTAVVWELADAGTVAGTTVTPRDAFPIASGSVDVSYTAVLSAQLLRNEFVENKNTVAPNLYYPFYVFDVDRATRQLLNDVTIAGVIPAYSRIF